MRSLIMKHIISLFEKANRDLCLDEVVWFYNETIKDTNYLSRSAITSKLWDLKKRKYIESPCKGIYRLIKRKAE